jgi:monoamine oxidase
MAAGRTALDAMNRRRFLRLSAAAAAPALIRSSWAGQIADPGDRVVIVGAGLAGLRAAELVRKTGRQVVVLEARAQAGGRVLTIRSPFDDGLFAEAGPVRIPAAHRTVLRLARERGLTLVPFEPSAGSTIHTIGGMSVRSDELDRATVPLDLRPDERRVSPSSLLERYAGDLPADMADPAPSPGSFSRWQPYDRQTWPDWLRSRGASAGAVRLMTLGGDSSDLSALYVLRQFALLRKSTQFFKIRGGMDLLPRAIASSLGDAVRCNAEVVRVDHASRRLQVDYLENGSLRRIEASHLILAIPFSTLRHIEMRPPFSREKAGVIEDLPYFPATRFLLQSRSRFWRESGLSGAARTDRPAEIWDSSYDLPGTRGILGVTVGGAIGRAVLDMSPDDCVTFGKEIAAEAFPKLRVNFEKGVACRWALERWSRGAFAVFRPGQMVSMMPEIPRPEGRVHFAGEHTSAWMGWMEGALESGERAAREVLNEGPG